MATDAESVLEYLHAQVKARRDFGDTFGYDANVLPVMLRKRYDRGDIVRALVDARPDATWSGRNELLLDGEESPELDRIARRYRLWLAFQRADLAQEITGYSVIVLPGRDLEAPPVPAEAEESRLAVWGADDITWDANDIGPDGRPTRYTLAASGRQERIDASRCLHVADPRYSKSLLVGLPRLVSAWNRIADWERTVGGGAMGYEEAARPGFHLGFEEPPTDGQLKKIYARLKQFVAGRVRSMATTALDFQRIAPDPPDFSANGDFMVKVLATAFRVPLTEVTNEALVAHSATTARQSWHDRIDERRYDWIEPDIVAEGVAWFESIRSGMGGARTYEDTARIGVRWAPWNEPTSTTDPGSDDGGREPGEPGDDE